MGQPTQTRTVHFGGFSLSRVLMFVACVLFVIASLAAGNVFTDVSWTPWMLGGLAAVALAWAA